MSILRYDSSVANRSASVRLLKEPKIVSFNAFPSRSDRARLPFVEPPRAPWVNKTELFEVEMMAEPVAKGAQECTERRDLSANRGPHPHANQHGFWCVVAKKARMSRVHGCVAVLRPVTRSPRSGVYRNLRRAPETRRRRSGHLEFRLIADSRRLAIFGNSLF